MNVDSNFGGFLDSNDPQVLRMEAIEGPMVAKRFVSLYNNKCVQLAGFDQFLFNNIDDIHARGSYVASEHSMSWSICH